MVASPSPRRQVTVMNGCVSSFWVSPRFRFSRLGSSVRRSSRLTPAASALLTRCSPGGRPVRTPPDGHRDAQPAAPWAARAAPDLVSRARRGRTTGDPRPAFGWRRWAVERDDPTVIHDGHPVAQALGFLHVVRGEEAVWPCSRIVRTDPTRGGGTRVQAGGEFPGRPDRGGRSAPGR